MMFFIKNTSKIKGQQSNCKLIIFSLPFQAGVALREVDQIPWIHNDRWKKDEEFGRQILNGINPGTIERVRDQLPKNFPVENGHIQGLLCRGVSLETEIAMGNVFIINYKVFLFSNIAVFIIQNMACI